MRVKDDSLLKKYEEEDARLEALKATLKVEERRLRWFPLVGLAVGVAIAVAHKPIYGFLVFSLGIVMAGTGLYLTRVHTMERDYNLVRAKEELARLRARATKPEEPDAPA